MYKSEQRSYGGFDRLGQDALLYWPLLLLMVGIVTLQAKWEHKLSACGLGIYCGAPNWLLYVPAYHEDSRTFAYSGEGVGKRMKWTYAMNAERLRRLRREHPERTRLYQQRYRAHKKAIKLATERGNSF